MKYLQQPFFEGFADCAGAGLNPEFGVNVAEVVVDRVETEEKLFGDLFFRQTVDKEFQDFVLSRRKTVIGCRCTDVGEDFQHFSGDFRTHWSASIQNRREGFHGGFDRGALM